MARLIAWTGGSSPAPFASLDAPQRATVKAAYAEQCSMYEDFWGKAPDVELRRVFWNRARHDAHATHREPHQ